MLRIVRPLVPDKDSLWQHLAPSFEAGHLSNFGPAEQALTRALGPWLGVNATNQRVLLTSSGHVALMAAYDALEVDALVVPAYTFISTLAAAAGLPVFHVDVSPVTGCLEVEQIEERVNSVAGRRLGVVAVCGLGNVPDIAALADYCHKRKAKLIVDAAATFGTPVNTGEADAYCYSFHATKTLSIGEAGALVLREEHYRKAKAFINFGRDDDKRQITSGMNGKLSEYSAAVGLALLDNAQARRQSQAYTEHVARRANAVRYRELLGPTRLLDSFHRGHEVAPPVYAVQPILADSPAHATRAHAALARAGVQALAYYPPLACGFPVSDNLYTRNVCVPVHGGVMPEDIERICAIIEETA